MFQPIGQAIQYVNIDCSNQIFVDNLTAYYWVVLNSFNLLRNIRTCVC